MTAAVINQDGSFFKVKNLGWLLRHRGDGISEVHVYPRGDGEGSLEVGFENGRWYNCNFASLDVCLGWVERYLLKNGWAAVDALGSGTLSLLRQRWHLANGVNLRDLEG